jgi:DNA-directed RNA polymerase specialized sigma24 family protein
LSPVADPVSLALLVVLETIPPSERLAFMMRDLLAIPLPDVAFVLGCSTSATQQLAIRARRRIHGAAGEPDPAG